MACSGGSRSCGAARPEVAGELRVAVCVAMRVAAAVRQRPGTRSAAGRKMACQRLAGLLRVTGSGRRTCPAVPGSKLRIDYYNGVLPARGTIYLTNAITAISNDLAAISGNWRLRRRRVANQAGWRAAGAAPGARAECECRAGRSQRKREPGKSRRNPVIMRRLRRRRGSGGRGLRAGAIGGRPSPAPPDARPGGPERTE